MPYVKPEDRTPIEEWLFGIHNPGKLNYCITRLVLEFLGDSPNYERFNAAIGVLECAKQELYRRRVAPYEDLKIEENGDVYP